MGKKVIATFHKPNFKIVEEIAENLDETNY